MAAALCVLLFSLVFFFFLYFLVFIWEAWVPRIDG